MSRRVCVLESGVREGLFGVGFLFSGSLLPGKGVVPLVAKMAGGLFVGFKGSESVFRWRFVRRWVKESSKAAVSGVSGSVARWTVQGLWTVSRLVKDEVSQLGRQPPGQVCGWALGFRDIKG